MSNFNFREKVLKKKCVSLQRVVNESQPFENDVGRVWRGFFRTKKNGFRKKIECLYNESVADVADFVNEKRAIEPM